MVNILWQKVVKDTGFCTRNTGTDTGIIRGHANSYTCNHRYLKISRNTEANYLELLIMCILVHCSKIEGEEESEAWCTGFNQICRPDSGLQWHNYIK